MASPATDFWVATQSHGLGTRMKVNDLHMVYNPVSNLLKVFDVNGHLVRQFFAAGRADSCGLWEPKETVGFAQLHTDYPEGSGPHCVIAWQPLQEDKGFREGMAKKCPFERWYFVRTDFQLDEVEKSVLKCHLWALDPGSFVQLYQLLMKTELGGGTTYFEICGKHMIRSDVLNAMMAAR